MRYSTRTTALFAALLTLHVARLPATPAATRADPEWNAWLGCWASVPSVTASRVVSPNTTCIVPVSDSRGVELLTIVRGKVVTRDRLEAGQPHPIDGQGCSGTETATWSGSGRRLFFRSSYRCSGDAPGASATIFALTPIGELLRVEQVRAGDAAIEMIDRLRDVPAPDVVSTSAVRAIQREQRAIKASRASAAAPITIDEIIDGVHSLDAGVVQSWVGATDQLFDLTGQQLTILVAAGVPAPVLQAVLDSDARARGAIVVDVIRRAAVYASAAPVAMVQPAVTTINNYAPEVNQPPAYGYAQDGCYMPSPYSAYNGCAYGFAPGVLPFGFPFSPLLAAPFVVQNDGRRNNGNHHDGNHSPSRPNQPNRPNNHGSGRGRH